MSAGDLPALPELLTDRELQSLRNLMPGLGSDAADEIVELRAAVAQRDEQIEQFRETIRKITSALVSAGFASDRSFIWDDVQRMADTVAGLQAELAQANKFGADAHTAAAQWMEKANALRAERDAFKAALHGELDGNLRLRDLGGARPDEGMTAYIERLIAERDALTAEVEALRRVAASAQAVTTGGEDKIDYFRVPSHLMAALALALDDAARAEAGPGGEV